MKCTYCGEEKDGKAQDLHNQGPYGSTLPYCALKAKPAPALRPKPREMVWGDVVPLGYYPTWAFSTARTNAELVAEGQALLDIWEDAPPKPFQPLSYPDHRNYCGGCGFPHAFNYNNCVWDRP